MTLPLTDLPELAAGQLQPEIPINSALRGLEQGATRIIVIDDSLTAPPVSPAQGDAYVVAATATGAWLGREDEIAYWIGTAWAFIPPRVGLRYTVAGGNSYEYRDGTPDSWEQITAADVGADPAGSAAAAQAAANAYTDNQVAPLTAAVTELYLLAALGI